MIMLAATRTDAGRAKKVRSFGGSERLCREQAGFLYPTFAAPHLLSTRLCTEAAKQAARRVVPQHAAW